MKLQAVLDTFWPLGRRYRVPILTYHSIHRQPKPECLDMTPECFARQMEFLAIQGYKVVGLEESLSYPLPRRAVSISFDDGYDNTYTQAFPILKRHEFPATVFVVTDWIEKEDYLSLSQIKEMESGGITIGSHGCSHRYLPELPISQAQVEITKSKEILEEKLRHPIHFFCYPYGGFSEEVVEWVRRAGYRAAFTTNRGFKNQPPDLYTLRRIRMGPTTRPISLWAKCSGYYDLLRKPRPAH